MRKVLAFSLAFMLAFGPAAFARTVRNVPGQVLEVCKNGNCTYSSINTALAAITDASTTKRYTVEIGPGVYDENVTAKSYVTLHGSSPHTTFISKTGSGGANDHDAVTIGDTVTEFGIENLTLAAAAEQGITTTNTRPASRRTIYVTNSIVGGDTTSNVDAIVDSGGNTTWIMHGNIFRSKADIIRIIAEDFTWYGDSNTFETANTAANQGVFNCGSSTNNCVGFRIFESGSTVRATATTLTDFAFLLVNPSGGTDTQSIILDFSNLVIDIDQTNAGAGNPNTGCFKLNALPTPAVSSPAPVFRITDVTCRVSTTATGASATAYGLWIANDADFAPFNISWNGGRIQNTVAAGTAHGIRNLQASTTVNVRALSNNGTNTATGPILVNDSGDLTAGTCLRGQTFVDTAATVEFCVCGTTGTWGCWKMTDGTFNNNGPVD